MIFTEPANHRPESQVADAILFFGGDQVKLTLRTRILFVLLIVFTLLGATAYIIHSRILLPSFLELEQQHVSANIKRVINALKNEQQHLAQLGNDWSVRNDTYAYLDDHNTAYETSNLADSTFIINQINLFYLLDSSGQKVWGKAFAEDFVTPITLQPFDLDRFPADFPLLQYRQEQLPLSQQQSTGLLMTSVGPMFCTARPILDSSGQSPSRGTLIMGRLLSQEMIKKIARLTDCVFEVKTDLDQTSTVASWTQQGKPDLLHINYSAKETTISASATLTDLTGKPAIEIAVHEPRAILKQGLKALRIALTLMVTGFAFALGMMLLMLQRSVITPIRQLSGSILAQDKANHSAPILKMGACTSLEICLLTEGFNQLLENLDAKNTELGETNIILIEEAKKLKDAKHRLKRLDQLKSEFISTAAHELRTPVASIMGFTELLSDHEMFGSFTEDQKTDFLQEIYENCEGLTKIVDDILDISRIEAGRSIPLDKKPTSIKVLLQKILKRFDLKASHLLVLDIKPGVPESLNFDAHRIGQVMVNLLSNALKYSPEESTVTIIVEQENSHCKITVNDQGIGMTVEQKIHIFDKFYRADASNTAVRGLGLGMSIVKQIVEDHGGTIWVDSSLGEGTQVYFTLPARQDS